MFINVILLIVVAKVRPWVFEDDDLLEKYNNVWNKISNSINKELDSEPIYNKKFLKTKIRSYGDEARNFHVKETPQVGSNNTCLTVILIDFVLKKDQNY